MTARASISLVMLNLSATLLNFFDLFIFVAFIRSFAPDLYINQSDSTLALILSIKSTFSSCFSFSIFFCFSVFCFGCVESCVWDSRFCVFSFCAFLFHFLFPCLHSSEHSSLQQSSIESESFSHLLFDKDKFFFFERFVLNLQFEVFIQFRKIESSTNLQAFLDSSIRQISHEVQVVALCCDFDHVACSKGIKVRTPIFNLLDELRLNVCSGRKSSIWKKIVEFEHNDFNGVKMKKLLFIFYWHSLKAVKYSTENIFCL